MSRRRILVSVLAGVFVVIGSLAVLAQVAGDDVGRNILRMARQKNAGEAVTEEPLRTEQPASQPSTAAKVEPVKPAAPAAPAAVAPRVAIGADDVLALLPADCLFCVRINKLDSSLGAVDQYIAGVSPIPLSVAMLAKMQLGNLLGDPMLAGVNTGGDLAIFAMPLPAEPGAFMPQVGLGMLVPVSGQEFYQQRPDSQLPGGRHALVALVPSMAEAVDAVKQRMASSALAGALSPDVLGESQTAPAWAHVNIAAAVEVFGPMLFAQVDQMTAMMQQRPGTEANAKVAMAQMEFAQAFLMQLDSLSAVIDPRPNALHAAVTLHARPNTDLAAMLVADPAMKPGHSLGGFLNESAAVNVLAKVNRPLFEKLSMSVIGLLTDSLADTMPAGTLGRMTELVASSLQVMGDEQALSLAPPADFRQIIKVQDADGAKALMQAGLAAANEMYKGMGLEAGVSLEAGDMYRQSQIYTFKLDMAVPALPAEADLQQREMFEELMGSASEYRVAFVSGFMVMAGGPDADGGIRRLIDAAGSGSAAVSGDIRTALMMLPGVEKADFVASINVPRLLSGFGGIVKSAAGAEGAAIADMLDGVNVVTKSCMGVAGRVENGRGRLDIVIPKEHLLDMVMMAGSMQMNTGGF